MSGVLCISYRWAAAAILLFFCLTTRGELVLSEVLFNPPGDDTVTEAIELRGTPNFILPASTCFLAVEGNAGANPGTIRNVFALSGHQIGGNGFLVLLQKASPYLPATGSKILLNTGADDGWGSGNSSSIGHRGGNGILELENASVTFFLIQSDAPPSPGTDIDQNDDGNPDGTEFARWTILDSVGVLDADGAGDFAYGKVNFRRNTSPGNGAGALGTVIPIGFTPRYVGRTRGSNPSAQSWTASADLTGSAPDWFLAETPGTYPTTLAGGALNHWGAPNFGDGAIPGVVLQSQDVTVIENGPSATIQFALNTAPSGLVTLRLECAPGLSLETQGLPGLNPVAFTNLTSTAPAVFNVRALNGLVLGPSPSPAQLHLSITSTADPVNYPINSLTPRIEVNVADDEWAVFNEVKCNPPGTNDAPFEFLELLGSPGAILTNIYVLALDSEDNPGKVEYALDLTSATLGSNGLLLIAASNSPYSIPSSTRLFVDPQLGQASGALPNQPVSFLLLASRHSVRPGEDLDQNDNGVLEGLPDDARLLDSLAFSGGGAKEVLYSSAILARTGILPDAATRYPGTSTPHDGTSWLTDDLAGLLGGALAFRGGSAGELFYSQGTALTPGASNQIAPTFTPILPVSGVVDYALNPGIIFDLWNPHPEQLVDISVESSNPSVVGASDISIKALSENSYLIQFNARGVGYSDISFAYTVQGTTGTVTFPYASSSPGRPGGKWLLGASDGSAGVPAGDGHYWIADDEDQLIRLYDVEGAGLPIRSFNAVPFLDLPDVESGWPREVDIEAAAHIGDLCVWIGSHGHAALGEPRTNRTRIFATRLIGSGADSHLEYVGRYDSLKSDLIAWDNSNAHGKGARHYRLEASDADGVAPKAPDGSGFAIEGLAMMPGDTNGAFIGFRAPIVPAADRTCALVVPVLNLLDLVTNNGGSGSARFGPPVELDLYGRGIRSIDSDSDGLLIVAGPGGAAVGTYPQDFRLYAWSGSNDAPAKMLSADLSGLNPEGILSIPERPWTTTSQFVVVSDAGTWTYYGDDVPAKELPHRFFEKCRLDSIPMGDEVKPSPIITAVDLMNPDIRVSWRSLAGETYVIQGTSTLSTQDWTELSLPIQAKGPHLSASIPMGSSPRFLRIKLLGVF